MKAPKPMNIYANSFLAKASLTSPTKIKEVITIGRTSAGIKKSKWVNIRLSSQNMVAIVSAFDKMGICN